jgi:hypothetical protein
MRLIEQRFSAGSRRSTWAARPVVARGVAIVMERHGIRRPSFDPFARAVRSGRGLYTDDFNSPTIHSMKTFVRDGSSRALG